MRTLDEIDADLEDWQWRQEERAREARQLAAKYDFEHWYATGELARKDAPPASDDSSGS